jgi:hypothetical protein
MRYAHAALASAAIAILSLAAAHPALAAKDEVDPYKVFAPKIKCSITKGGDPNTPLAPAATTNLPVPCNQIVTPVGAHCLAGGGGVAAAANGRIYCWAPAAAALYRIPRPDGAGPWGPWGPNPDTPCPYMGCRDWLRDSAMIAAAPGKRASGLECLRRGMSVTLMDRRLACVATPRRVLSDVRHGAVIRVALPAGHHEDRDGATCTTRGRPGCRPK